MDELCSPTYEIHTFATLSDPNCARMYDIWGFIHDTIGSEERLKRIKVAETYLHNNDPKKLTQFWIKVTEWYVYQFKVNQYAEFSPELLIKEFPHMAPMVDYHWSRIYRSAEIVKHTLHTIRSAFIPDECCLM